MNKIFAIAGTGQEEQTSAINEMVSALEDGVVSSEELKIILSKEWQVIESEMEKVA